jgi:hypothetical protein
VVNTKNGTTRLSTGDTVRVDGRLGTVECIAAHGSDLTHSATSGGAHASGSAYHNHG